VSVKSPPRYDLVDCRQSTCQSDSEPSTEATRTPEIARNPAISITTVKAHLAQVMLKLDARNRVETFAAARARGLSQECWNTRSNIC
jgi:hypothetical protein